MAAADPNATTMLDHALLYLSQGFPVFPVCSPLMGLHQHRKNGKLADCAPDKRGKNPMVRWGDYQEELPSEEQVRSWWRRWPNANIGMATGRLSRVVVLDCDSGEARTLCMSMGGLEETPAVWTGAPGGIHFWLRCPENDTLRNFVKDIPGTDFRGEGGYVLLPPSRHHRGATYRWNEHTIGMEIAPVPAWLLQLFEDKAASKGPDGEWSGEVLDVDEMLKGFPEGQRDNGLFKLACRFRHDDQPQAYAEAMILVAARNCDPAFDDDEAIAKVRYVYGKYEAGNVGPTLEDDGWFAPPCSGIEPEVAPPPAVFLRPISELLAMEEVEPDWLVDQLFTAGSNGWVAAEPKVGKSWTVLELIYALSTGSPFLGRFAVKQPRRTIYIQEEDSLQRVLRRFKKLLKGDSSRVPPRDDYLRWAIRAGFKVDNLAWMGKLREEIESFKAEVVVLDVFNRLHSSEDTKQAEMNAILNTLSALTNQYGCSFIIVHHNRKQQAGNEARANQMMRGSGVLAGWSECSLYLRKGREKHVFIVTPESKDAPELDDFSVTLRDLDNGGIILDIGIVSPNERTSKIDGDIVAAVEKITRDGLDATVQRIADHIRRERSGVQKRMRGLIEEGILDEDEVQMGRVFVKIYTVATL